MGWVDGQTPLFCVWEITICISMSPYSILKLCPESPKASQICEVLSGTNKNIQSVSQYWDKLIKYANTQTNSYHSFILQAQLVSYWMEPE